MPCSAKLRNQNFQISSSFSFMIIRLCPPLYTYSPFILGKLTWPQKFWRFDQFSLFPLWCPDFVVSLGMHGPIMTYFTSPTWLSFFSGKLSTSARVMQESNLNQNCIQQQKRTPSEIWVSEKRYHGQRHVPCTQVCWVPPLGKMSS